MKKRKRTSIPRLSKLFLALVGVVLSLLGFRSCFQIFQPNLYGPPPTPYIDSIDDATVDSVIVDTLGKVIKSDSTR